MDRNPFAPTFDSLPETLPIFPLMGVLLLPHGQLPLNIFEPRYIAMVEDAKASNRMIGMLQPKNDGEIYQMGCAGKITEFVEMPDGRYTINLSGICRFKVTEELELVRGYRVIRPDWSPFEGDLKMSKCLGIDRQRLLFLLKDYFDQEGMSCSYEKLENIEDSQLITCLSMVCPFEAAEKQVILEKICHLERAKTFMAMLEMAIKSGKTLDKSKMQCH